MGMFKMYTLNIFYICFFANYFDVSGSCHIHRVNMKVAENIRRLQIDLY